MRLGWQPIGIDKQSDGNYGDGLHDGWNGGGRLENEMGCATTRMAVVGWKTREKAAGRAFIVGKIIVSLVATRVTMTSGTGRVRQC